jgi:phosphatidylserine/phosphatidylglycerophosphate/cardiolipin synthase-like enzyme
VRIALTLLVRDEADIVRANVEHHLAHGVDVIIATDNGSVDGTREILADYERAGTVRLIDEPARDYDQWRWVTRMARLAAAEHGADWILHADADEFWSTDGGSLADVLAAVPQEYGWLRVKRFNFVPSSREEQPFFERLVLRDMRSRNSFGRPLLEKICHRADEIVWLSQGNHDIETQLQEYTGELALRILHFPVRSYAQFERKVVLGGRSYARNTELEPEIGDVWRQLYRRYLRGELRDWYDRQIPAPAAVTRRIASGRYVVDRSIDDFCRRVMLDGAAGVRRGPPRARARTIREPTELDAEMASVEVHAHSRRAGIDGRIEERLIEFIDGAQESLVCAVFDLRATAVGAALHEADERGVEVRVRVDPSSVWPDGHGCDAKPAGAASVVRDWRLPVLTAHRGVMHHKFIVRDRSATWTGSANFTPDGLHGEDNDCVVMHSRAIAAAFLAAFEAPRRPPDSVRVALPDGELAALFAPGSGMREEILAALEKATRIRIVAYALEDPTLLAVLRRRRDGGADIAGAYDAQEMAALLHSDRRDPRQFWFLLDDRFAAATGDRLHNRLIVADDTVITGSANFTAAACTSAENAVLIRSPTVAAGYYEYVAAVVSACRRDARRNGYS